MCLFDYILDCDNLYFVLVIFHHYLAVCQGIVCIVKVKMVTAKSENFVCYNFCANITVCIVCGFKFKNFMIKFVIIHNLFIKTFTDLIVG